MRYTNAMNPLAVRPRRLRGSAALRSLVRETTLGAGDFVYPLFVRHGTGIKSPIASLAGQFHFSPDTLLAECDAALNDGIRAVLLFGIPDTKDATGSEGWSEHGAVQVATRLIKARFP